MQDVGQLSVEETPGGKSRIPCTSPECQARPVIHGTKKIFRSFQNSHWQSVRKVISNFPWAHIFSKRKFKEIIKHKGKFTSYLCPRSSVTCCHQYVHLEIISNILYFSAISEVGRPGVMFSILTNPASNL